MLYEIIPKKLGRMSSDVIPYTLNNQGLFQKAKHPIQCLKAQKPRFLSGIQYWLSIHRTGVLKKTCVILIIILSMGDSIILSMAMHPLIMSQIFRLHISYIQLINHACCTSPIWSQGPLHFLPRWTERQNAGVSDSKRCRFGAFSVSSVQHLKWFREATWEAMAMATYKMGPVSINRRSL